MELTYDHNKNLRNIAERKIAFDDAINFIWATASIIEDTRKDYGERRFRALQLYSGTSSRLGFYSKRKRNTCN